MAPVKLLFDENLSYRLVKSLTGYFDARHVSNEGLSSRPDRQIWQHAGLNDWIILTNDSDFQFLSSVYGCPPKVIRINSGNRSTKELAEIIIARAERIHQFSQSTDCYLEFVIDN